MNHATAKLEAIERALFVDAMCRMNCTRQRAAHCAQMRTLWGYAAPCLCPCHAARSESP